MNIDISLPYQQTSGTLHALAILGTRPLDLKEQIHKA
jgi:hypothetical protein